MLLRIGAAAGFVAAALSLGITTGDPNTLRHVVIALLTVAALCVVNRHTWSIGRSGIVLLALVAYYVSALGWSLDWRHGVHRLVLLAPFVAMFFVLSRADVFEYLPQAAVVAVIGALLLRYNYHHDIHGGFGNRNFISEFLVIALPFAMLGVRKRWFAVPSLIAIGWASFFLIFQSGSKIWAFAAVLVPVVFAAQSLKDGKSYPALVAALATVNAVMWFAALKKEAVGTSILARLEILINTMAAWADAPWFGNGSGSFNYAYHNHAEDHLSGLSGFSAFDITMYAGAAHNEIAQILAEHGIFGLVLAALFLIVLAKHWRGKKRDELDVAAAWSLGLTLWLSLIGFPLHVAATAMVSVVSASIIARGEPARVVGSACTPGAASIGGVLAIAVFTSTIMMAAGNHNLNVARSILNTKGGDSIYALRANVAAYDTWPYDQLTRRQLIMTTAKVFADHWGDVAIQPEAADKIYEISRSAGTHVATTLIARVDYLMSAERHDDAAEEIENVLSVLKKTASRHKATWYTDAKYAMSKGDTDRAKASIAKIILLGKSGLPKEQIESKIDEFFKELPK